MADTFSFFVKFSHPAGATQTSCKVQGADMQLLIDGGAFDAESGVVADRSGANHHGVGAKRLSAEPAPWAPADEIGAVKGGGFVWITTPQNVIIDRTAAGVVADLTPPGVPVSARPSAIVANVHTWQTNNDDQMSHAFGRTVSDAVFTSIPTNYASNLDPVTTDGYWNDVVLTHHGENGKDYYGHSHGTQIIPLKDNFKFDVNFGFGKADTSTHHVITIQVYGCVRRLCVGWWWCVCGVFVCACACACVRVMALPGLPALCPRLLTG